MNSLDKERFHTWTQSDITLYQGAVRVKSVWCPVWMIWHLCSHKQLLWWWTLCRTVYFSLAWWVACFVTTRKLGSMEWIWHFPTSFSNLNAAFLFELTRCFSLWGRHLHWCLITFSAELSVEEARVQPANLQASEGDAFICCFLWLLPPGFGQFILCPHSSDLQHWNRVDPSVSFCL